MTRMTVLGWADASKEMLQGGWRPLSTLGDTVTVDAAMVCLAELPGAELADWPLGEAAMLDGDSLDE